MSVGTAKFYNMEGSLSSAEYPLFEEYQDLSEFKLNECEIRYAKGLQTRFDVPMFNGWDTVNVIELDGEFYWATSARESTTFNGSVTYTCDYMAPTSLIKMGQRIRASWHKAPINVCPYLRDSITNDIMMIAEEYDQLDRITCPDVEVDPFYDTHTFWLQVSGFDANGKIKLFGCFVPYFEEMESFHTDYYGNHIKAFNDGTDDLYYPNVDDIISDITGCCGLLAENIIDISISRRCPYVMTESGNYLTLYNWNPDKEGTNNYVMYDLWSGPASLNTQSDFVLVDFDVYNDNWQRGLAQVAIRDWNNNVIMEISTMESDQLIINFQEVSDIMGLYLKIWCNDQSIMIPEGHLPYQGSNWETYKAYQMDTDRMIMENAISNAKENRDTQAVSGTINAIIGGVSTGVMTGILGGNVAGAAVGVTSGILGTAVNQWELNRAFDLEKRKAEFNRQISQRQAVMQPETTYNLGYGMVYGYQNVKNPVKVCKMLPKNISDLRQYYGDWSYAYGYPAEGIIDIDATYGFYQGELLSFANGLIPKGQRFDRLNEVMMNGFKFISP